MSENLKAREDWLRRMAANQSLRLCKNRRRWIREHYGDQYHLVDHTNTVVRGAQSREYDATLDEIEAFLTDDTR
jgi:hypothetical protein